MARTAPSIVLLKEKYLRARTPTSIVLLLKKPKRSESINSDKYCSII